jgi:type I restriction enzyme S subunit
MTILTPEQKARETIDHLLDAAGWSVQSRDWANLTRAGRLRQAILKKVFEGRLVGQDPEDELASVLLERIEAQREA